MALDVESDDWQDAENERKSEDNKTGVSTEALKETMADLGVGQAYSTAELYKEITGEEPDGSDDLRSFVPIWSQMTLKNEDGLLQKHKDDLPEGTTIERKKVDEDAGYEGWYFALMEE